MKKRIILLIIILLSIFMIGTVSATTNNTDKVSTKLTDKKSNKEIIKKDNTIKDQVSITYNGDFDDLERKINNTKTGGTLNLQKNYKYTNSSKEGITITKSITINGNGHTLNGNKKSRIFNVTRGVHLILKNLNLNNGNRIHEYGYGIYDDGGVIYAVGAKVTTINCNFTNNNAYEGGAIYADSGKVIMINSTFTNIIAHGALYAGAIYAGNVVATNCVFTNNNNSVILATLGKVNVTNCVFTNNRGGAIHADDVNVSNCVFTNNSGALSADNVTATNCKFTNNNYNAISAYFGEVTATNCVFTNNKDSAISTRKVNVTNCKFSKNNRKYDGGAINAGEVTATNCVFTNNYAKNGGAIYTELYLYDKIKNKVTVTNCTFNKNNAECGGAIYIGESNTNIKIKNSRFINNKAKKNKDSSGIYITEYSSNLLIKKTTFKDDSIYCEFLCDLKLINTKVKVNKKSYIKVTPNPIEFGSNTYIIFKSNKNCNVDIHVDGKEIIYRDIKTINKIIKKLKIGKHTINIKIFTEDLEGRSDRYSKTFKIKVTKPKPKITAKPQTYKTQIKTKKYKITLKNKQNKPIKTAKVTLKIGKKTYPAKTNTKGVALFKITKLNKKGKYTATITYKGDKKYNKATKKIKITIK